MSSPAAVQGGVPPATNFELRNGPNAGETVISWDAVPQATHYRIGYVNMEVDYHLAKASCTEEWIEAFVYIDVNARNIPVRNGRAEYTLRRLAPGARHAFTVLTSSNFADSGSGGSVRSEFFWPPQGSRWEFLQGRDTLPPGVTLPTGECFVPTAGDVRLATLFDEIISKTEKREAFSPIKETNIGFSAIADMKALRSEFIASNTDTELYYALWKLSNVRRDRHLGVRLVSGGLEPQLIQSCVSAPLRVLPDLSDIHNPTFFVARVDGGLTAPEIGDTVVDVNGRSMTEYIEEFAPWIRHSSLPGLYWLLAYDLPERVWYVPQSLYSEQLNLGLENSSGVRYEVSLPYNEGCGEYTPGSSYPGFNTVMQRENFNVHLDRNREMVLLQWLDFEMDNLALVNDIKALMEYAERERLLDYDLIIDVTWSSGGSGGAYAIQRLVDEPFRVTFGNVRLSDLGKGLVEYYASRTPRSGQPDIFGLNLSRSWLYDWARTDAMEAIRRGDEYTPAVPFKLAHLPKDSDGILQPAPVHFSGEVVIINARTRGGSHLDQFVAMFVDNDLATFIGVPTGGYSNTWEGYEDLYFADTGQPVVKFMWSIGHTIRPNGEILEGNPAQPDVYMPLTRENFQRYYQTLLDTAVADLAAER